MGRFAVLWLGLMVSFLGTAMTSFAIGVEVFQRSRSVSRFSLVMLSVALPVLLISPLAGAAADRFNRRLVLLVSQFGAAMPQLGLWFLVSHGRLETWHIYPLLAIGASFAAFLTPTLSAIVSQMVDSAHYARASGLVRMGTSLSRIGGPFLGALALAAFGLANVLLLNVTSYLVALGVLLAIRLPRLPSEPEAQPAEAAATPSAGQAATAAGAPSIAQPTAAPRGLTAGWHFIRQRPGLLRMLLVFASVNLFIGLVQILTTPLILAFASPTVLGLVASLASSGVLIGATLVAIAGSPKQGIRAVLMITALQGATLLIAGLRPSAPLIAVGAFLFMMAFPLSASAIQVIWLRKTPMNLQGRVFSLRRMIAGSSGPLAMAIAGPLADHVFEPMMASNGALAGTVGRLLGTGEGRGIALMIVLAGLVLITITAATAAMPVVRNLETAIPDAVDGRPQSVPQSRRADVVALALRKLSTTWGLAALLLPLAFGILSLVAERPPTARGPDTPETAFAAARAQRHVERVAQAIHPTGTAANAAVRDYLVHELETLGLETQIQHTDVALAGRAIASLVTVDNVLARLPGTDGAPAVLLVSHYDSVPTSYGAADDGAGVASMLETARALVAGARLRHDVILLFTDGEEITLHGVRAFVDRHPWAREVAVAINLDARGYRGPVYMFQIGNNNDYWTRHFLQATPAPRASSLMTGIFRLLPNLTNFNVLRRAGIAGFDLAAIGGLTHYHTELDRAEELSQATLQHFGSYALPTTRALADLDLAHATTEPNGTFFTIGSMVVTYPAWLARVLAVLVTLAALGLLVAGVRRQRLRGFGIAQGFLSLFALTVLVPVTISLLWLVIRDGIGVSVVMGGTPASERFMLGFACLAAAMIIAAYRFFRRSASVLDLMAGAILWWLLALALTTDTVLDASSNFIVIWPLTFALVAFGWLCLRPITALSRRTTALLLAGAGLAATVLVMPFTASLYVALESLMQLGGVPLIPLVFMLALLLPQLEAALPARPAWPALILALAGMAITVSAIVDRGPQLSLTSALYAADQDRGEQAWFSLDPAPSAWNQPLGLVRGQRARFRRFLPVMGRPLLSSPARSTKLPTPEVAWLPRPQGTAASARPSVRLSIAATSRSHGRLLFFEPQEAVITLSIDGTPIAMAGSGAATQVVVRLPVRPHEIVTLRLRDPRPVVMTLVEQLPGLPPVPALAARGPGVLRRPFLSLVRSDVTLIRRSFRIDPAAGTVAPQPVAPQPVAPSSSASTAARVSSSASSSI